MYTVPDQTGRTVVVTGANSGTGREAAERLAAAGAHVVLAVRNAEKGEKALAEILRCPPGRLGRGADRRPRVAGVGRGVRRRPRARPRRTSTPCSTTPASWHPPRRFETEDGFELQMGSNFLGPFALTNRLLPLLLAAPGTAGHDDEQRRGERRPHPVRRPAVDPSPVQPDPLVRAVQAGRPAAGPAPRAGRRAARLVADEQRRAPRASRRPTCRRPVRRSGSDDDAPLADRQPARSSRRSCLPRAPSRCCSRRPTRCAVEGGYYGPTRPLRPGRTHRSRAAQPPDARRRHRCAPVGGRAGAHGHGPARLTAGQPTGNWAARVAWIRTCRSRKARSSSRLRRSQPVTSSLHLLALHEPQAGAMLSSV